MGGVHLVSPDRLVVVKHARRLLGRCSDSAGSGGVIATHNTTHGTVQMAPMATVTVAGCGLVMPGRPAHDLLLPPHMNLRSTPTR